MQQNPHESTPRSDARSTDKSRRGVLLAAGVVGAAAIADRFASPARAAQLRPVWLRTPSSGPSPADWNALRRRLSTDKLLRPGESGYGTAKLL
jgi:hypothetical protein